jgi:hypothetical protein
VQRQIAGQRTQPQAVQAVTGGRAGVSPQRGCDFARCRAARALDLDVTFSAVGESQRDSHDAAGVTGD